MASCLGLVVVVQALFIQIAFSQCVNRVVPNCGPNILPLESYLPLEGLLPNQVLLSQPVPVPVPANCAPYPYPTAVEPVAYAPTVIQDSSVANSLANALQLLVVSNLLRDTLPGCYEPGYYPSPYSPVGPIGPYGYVY